MGLPMWGASRAANMLTLQFGKPRQSESLNGPGSAGDYALHVSCSWRLAGATGILVASGDLFTPADPDADLETFDWDIAGASWWDVRMRELFEAQAASPPTVTTFVADALGGFRLVLSGGLELEVFPDSAPVPHVETEYWRLLRPGLADPHVVVGTTGIELVHDA
jgi:hypothetical protein